MYSKVSETDVLVIGAGPGGLMAAQALARLGVNAKLIDKRTKGSSYGNADGLQPRVMEILESYGLLQNIVQRSARMNVAVIYITQGEDITRLPPWINVQANTHYPYELTCSIETIEEVLRSSAELNGLNVEYGLEPVSIHFVGEEPVLDDPKSRPLEVVLKSSQSDNRSEQPETELVRAKFLLGADGARSFVRREFNIVMNGEKTEYIWGIIQGEIETDFPDFRFKSVIQSAEGAVVIIPREQDMNRIYVQLTEADVVRLEDGRVDMSPSRLSANIERVKTITRSALKQYSINFKSVTWTTIFGVAHEEAAKFSIGNRVFLLGDAAHTFSPSGGQGANAAILDGHNIAWKIAHVLRGWSSLDLLDTYEAERRPHAEAINRLDKEVVRMINAGGTTQFQSIVAAHSEFTSGINLCYSASALTCARLNSGLTSLTEGTRLPGFPLTRLADWNPVDLQELTPADGLWKLILFSPSDLDLSSVEKEITCEASMHVTVDVILNASPDQIHWTAVPCSLRQWKRVFAGCPPPPPLSGEVLNDQTVFSAFNIDNRGALLLLRPDGYTSMIEELTCIGVKRIWEFLNSARPRS